MANSCCAEAAFRDRFRNAVCGKDHGRVAIRNFVELPHKDRALLPEALHHILVVDDLVPDINRRAMQHRARSTASMARTTPAQNPRGAQSRMSRDFLVIAAWS